MGAKSNGQRVAISYSFSRQFAGGSARAKEPEGRSSMSLQPTTPDGTSPKNWAIIVWALYLASLLTGGLTSIVGIIIAYLKRRDLAGTVFESHMTSAIRTFWISVIFSIFGVVLLVVGIGVLVLVVIWIWFAFRSIRGLVRALDGRPIDAPNNWL
jgi:uncharacterized membrane protein